MKITPVVADELHHKMSIVADEPDLQECYEVTQAHCDKIITWCKARLIPEVVSPKLLLLMAGEMENAADITLDQYRDMPSDDKVQRNRAYYAYRSYCGFVSLMNEQLATSDTYLEPVEAPTEAVKPPRAVVTPEHPIAYPMTHVTWVPADGGRKDAGFKGETGDCGCRAIAIASGRPYAEIYARINELAKSERTGKRKTGVSDARTGVYRVTMNRLLAELGFVWVPLTAIGSGCKVHLHRDELPATGKFVLRLSKHFAAYVDGQLYDTYDCSRGGTRCVYGYWKLEEHP